MLNCAFGGGGWPLYDNVVLFGVRYLIGQPTSAEFPKPIDSQGSLNQLRALRVCDCTAP